MLAVCLLAIFATALAGHTASAWADELTDVRVEIADKTAELEELADGIKAEKAQYKTISRKIGKLLEELADKQAEYAQLQGEAADLATLMYKDGESLDVFVLLENSGSLSEFLYRIEMRERVLKSSDETLSALKHAQADLDGAYAKASAEKDVQQALIADMKAKRTEMTALLDELKQREKELDAEQKAALAQAAAKARRVSDTFATESGNADGGAGGSAGGSNAGGGTSGSAGGGDDGASGGEGNSQGALGGDGDPGETPTDESEADDVSSNANAGSTGASDAEEETGGFGDVSDIASTPSDNPSTATYPSGPPDPNDGSWHLGMASAYGGSSDSSTPNPGTTATGAICDDWSVGVAVPLAWGPTQYYGHYVEISYGGRSVVAPVVDCGGMGDGARALDLQPGVFKAFGANTCDDWGVREVSYRFL